MDIKNKIVLFAALVEAEQEQRLLADGMTVTVRDGNHKTTIHEGKKYARVDIGNSGRYMIEMSTGNIFGTKGYGVPHKGHFYGTVDTINEYNWGAYYPVKKQAPTPMQGCSSIPKLTFAPEPVAPVA